MDSALGTAAPMRAAMADEQGGRNATLRTCSLHMVTHAAIAPCRSFLLPPDSKIWPPLPRRMQNPRACRQRTRCAFARSGDEPRRFQPPVARRTQHSAAQACRGALASTSPAFSHRPIAPRSPHAPTVLFAVWAHARSNTVYCTQWIRKNRGTVQQRCRGSMQATSRQ